MDVHERVTAPLRPSPFSLRLASFNWSENVGKASFEQCARCAPADQNQPSRDPQFGLPHGFVLSMEQRLATVIPTREEITHAVNDIASNPILFYKGLCEWLRLV